MDLRVADVKWHTDIAGPWISSEIFVQGCFRACPGCFNPQTWDPDGGYSMSTGDIVRALQKFVPYRRLTISGGEPLLQAPALTEMLRMLRATSSKKWTILCYTSYTWEELCDMILSGSIAGDNILDLLMQINILVDGPFMCDLALPIRRGQFVGSSNQRVIDVRRTLADPNLVPHAWHEPLLARIKRMLNCERVAHGGVYCARSYK
jgi:anaerobic ribonucleoside-triphosphate reductase activating protein